MYIAALIRYDMISNTTQTAYLQARIVALEKELERKDQKIELLNAKIDVLEIAVEEAYLFI